MKEFMDTSAPLPQPAIMHGDLAMLLSSASGSGMSAPDLATALGAIVPPSNPAGSTGAGDGSIGDILGSQTPTQGDMIILHSLDAREATIQPDPGGEVEPPQHNDAESEEPIVVVGRRLTNEAPTREGFGGVIYHSDIYTFTVQDQVPIGDQPPEGIEPADPLEIPPPADHEAIEIVVKVEPLTPEQEVLVQKFKTAVENAGKAIQALDDNEQIEMTDGSIVTGRELKELWSRTDFVINPKDFGYANSTERGESALRYGDPQISFNIDLIEDYDEWDYAGLNFLILHDFGHLTAANQTFDRISSNPQSAVEQMANDIARAIAHDAGIPVLGPNEMPYSTPSPKIFAMSVSDSDGGGDSNGGGENDENDEDDTGGGWGDWENDEPI